jgi:lactobin A/cerein 7B family class IIb bacteriocin
MNTHDCELADAELENVTGGFWQIALFGVAVAAASAAAEWVVSHPGSGGGYKPSSSVGKGTV